MPRLTTEERRARERELNEAGALVGQFRAEWRGPGSCPPHLVAHQDPRTGLTTVHLHALPEQLAYMLAAVRAAEAGPVG